MAHAINPQSGHNYQTINYTTNHIMRTKALLALAAVAFFASTAMAESPKREMRSVWVAGMGIDWPLKSGTTASAQAEAKKEMIEYLDNFKAQNFTGICLHVRPRADAYYKSTLEPWSADVSGKRGTDPGWDPLQFVIDECHKRGMECYAWINPYRVNANSATYTTPFDNQWRADGIIFTNKTWTVFNPGLPAARKHCLDVMKEIYTNYAIDGMLFDDYFYPGDVMPKGSDEKNGADYELYKSSGTTMSLGDWRRNNVNTFVKELFDDIQKTRPDMRFGIGPAGVSRKSASRYGLSEPKISSGDWMYDDIYCDPLAWMEDGSIDFIAPQIYWAQTHATAPFEPLCQWWSDVAEHFGIHNYVSMASYKVNTAEFGGSVARGSKEIGQQVELTRKYTRNNAPGAIYYNAKSINGPGITGLGDYLAENQYTAPALVPVVSWKGHVNYPAPDGVTYAGGKLSWTAAKASEKAIVRYTVYAIPTTVGLDDAKAADGDGLDGKYLVDVSYGTSYALPASLQSDHWYAVCVYDGYGFESQPGLAGYSTEPSAPATLVSPADGASVDWDTEFSWSAVANATYRLQLATGNDFRTLFADVNCGADTKATVAMDGLQSGTKVYWRVVSTQPDKLAGYSNVRTFTSPAQKPAPTPVLTNPGPAQYEGGVFTLAWEIPNAQHVDNVLVEVAAQGTNFAKPAISHQAKADDKGLTVRAVTLGEGSFEWRVTASGPRFTPSTSETGTFTVANLPIGGTEPGYTVMNDPATYPKAGNIAMENLWIRAEKQPFQNHSFVEKGMMNRGMAATRSHVYLSGRSEGSSTADIFLEEYSAATGEHTRTIALSEDGRVPFYPCNDVIKDSEGNLCISNLSLNIAATPLVIHKVDTGNGALAEVARLTYSGGGRVDHVGIFGDVTTGNFTVFAAIASSDKVARWKVTNGAVGTAEAKTFTAFHPSSASGFSVAPKVFPVSENLFYADGHTTYWTLYNFGTGNRVAASFADAPEQNPKNTNDNGAATFSLAGKPYAVYVSEGAGVAGSGTARFTISSMGDDGGYKGMQQLWTVPADGLGTVASSTQSAPCDAVALSDSEANVFVYSPGNGLAAYRVHDTTNAVNDIAMPETTGTMPDFRIDGLTVLFGSEVDNAAAYTVTGTCVATGTRYLDLPCAGIYVLRIGSTARVIRVR